MVKGVWFKGKSAEASNQPGVPSRPFECARWRSLGESGG